MWLFLLKFKVIFMKEFFVKHRAKLLFICDILIIPAMFFCRWLSGAMLTGIDSECMWTYFGGQCVTCGGTHFVNVLLSGHIIEAFKYNQFIFLCLVLLILVYILLHLYWWFKLDFAKKILRYVFSIPSLIIFLSIMLVFLVVRNIPAVINIINLIKSQSL